MTNLLIAAIDGFLEARSQLQKRRAITPIERTLKAAMRKAFLAQGRAFLRGMAAYKDQFPLEEAVTEGQWERVFSDAEIASINLFVEPLDLATREALLAGGAATYGELGMIDVAFDLANPRAVQYLRDHGAARVTLINQTTRIELQRLIIQAADEGMSYSRLARVIRTQFEGFAGLKPQLHIRNRAELIAVTEVGDAYSEANLIIGRTLQDAGERMEKRWLTIGDGRVSDGCAANQAVGWIPLDDAFPSGHQRPLRFPGCRCDLLQRRVSEEEWQTNRMAQG
ncbi:MAG: phage minor head protein [Dehalococcoidia bacterium]